MRNFTGKITDWENEKMIQMEQTFGPWDYTVFGLLLAISALIGFYIAWKVFIFNAVTLAGKVN